jgi:ligand-binding sensor domain-containing protein
LQRFCWILFFTWCTAVMAQPARQFSFTHYGTAGGLISNQANALAQDAEGFIWIGTTDGLQRFDGIRYLSFRHQEKDSSSLPSNLVWQLLTDKQNQLWVLLADGRIGIFNTHSFRFKSIPTRFKFPVTPNSFAKHILTDSNGHLFYFVEGGEILTYNPGRQEFSADYNFFPGFTDNKILDFYPEPGSQRYWFSLDDGSLREFDYTTREVRQPVSVQPHIAHRHLFIDQQKHLWFTTELAGQQPAAGAYEISTGKVYLSPSTLPNDRHVPQDLTGFLQQQDGTIWIRGLHVLARFLTDSRQFQFVQNGYLNERSIQYERIHKIIEDREKSIWVATDNNGVYRFNPASEFISNHRHQDPVSGHLGEGGVICFIPLESGFLTATRGDGWFRYDNSFNLVPLQISGFSGKSLPNAYSACLSADGKTAFVGTASGFMTLNRKTLSITRKEFPQLQGPIKQILEDHLGNLWLGSNDGLFIWNGKDLISVIPAVSVNKLLLDSKHLLWVGTPENGLYLLDPRSAKTIDHFTTSGDPGRKLPEMGISSLLEYDSTSIYITTGNRLVRFDRQQRTFQTVVEYGLISGFNTAIEKDRKGYLWLTSTSGLYRLNPIKNILVRFTREDGIDNDHFEQSASACLAWADPVRQHQSFYQFQSG